jgi:hypothetical protein
MDFWTFFVAFFFVVLFFVLFVFRSFHNGHISMFIYTSNSFDLCSYVLPFVLVA